MTQKLEEARKLYQTANADQKYVLESLFPELKESEDERTRKEFCEDIWNYIPNEKAHKYIAWLEKQGEQKKSPYGEKRDFGYFEEKPADKVEPKFKVGDWITDGYVGGQITSIEDNYPCYKIADFMGGINTSIPFSLQDNYHLWTIQDAKDGDVLASKDKSNILIFRNLDTSTSFSSYYNIAGKGELGWSNECFIPATKEQRDLLFQKMKEAGYEWDAEKKELKKIEQRPWSEDDKQHTRTIIRAIHGAGNITPIEGEFAEKWLKSLKDRYTWKPSDEQMEALVNAIYYWDSFENHGYTDNTTKTNLKSLLKQLKKLKG